MFVYFSVLEFIPILMVSVNINNVHSVMSREKQMPPLFSSSFESISIVGLQSNVFICFCQGQELMEDSLRGQNGQVKHVMPRVVSPTIEVFSGAEVALLQDLKTEA